MPAASSLTVWIAGAVFLVGGFAAGYLVGQGGEALPDDEPAPLERAAAHRSAATPVLTLERPAAPAADEAHLDGARAAGLAPLRALLDAQPPPDIPRGNGVVHGTVKTGEGEGLAGVQVTLDPQRPRVGHRGDEADDLTVAVQQAIDAVRWRRQARRRTTTGADGTYRFEAVADLDHSLQAELAGWQIHPAGRRGGWQIRPDAEIDFVARAVARVPLTVVLPDGTVPDSASITTRQGNSRSGMGWSKQQPYVELQPGTWEITVTAGAAQQFRSDPLTVAVERGVAPTPLRFELKSSGAVHGHVEYAPGEQFQRGRVSLVRIPKGTKADPARLASSDKNTPLHNWGGGTPTFAFPDLAPGRYLVGLGRTWQGNVAVTEEVEVGEEAVEVVLKVPPLAREEYVVVALLGPEGKPLAGAQLLVGRKSGGGSSSGGATVIEREDGTIWVLHQEGDAAAEDADTTWWVEASHPEYGSQRAEYRRTRASAVELRFGKPGALEVTVAGVAGTRYEGRIHAGLGERSSRGGDLDAEGRITLQGLQPGAYLLTLSLGGDRGWSTRIHEEEVQVHGGGNRVRIVLPPLYEVELLGVEGSAYVRGDRPVPGRGPGSVQRRRPFVLQATATADGRATVDGLPAGEYQVGSGRKNAKFTVPGTTTVRLE